MDYDVNLIFTREQIKRMRKSSDAVLLSRNPQSRLEKMLAKRKPQILDIRGYDII